MNRRSSPRFSGDESGILRKRGFTLMEVIVSIAVVAILLTSFLAIFAPASSGIRRAVSSQDAVRLADALEREMSVLRVNEQGRYQSPFQKAFEWQVGAGDLSNAVIGFQYRAFINNNTGGYPDPFLDQNGIAGQDYLLQTALFHLGGENAQMDQLLQAVEGPVFAIRLRPMILQNGTMVEAQQGQVTLDNTVPVLPMKAAFFRLPSVNASFVRSLGSRGDFQQSLGRPVYECNLALRR